MTGSGLEQKAGFRDSTAQNLRISHLPDGMAGGGVYSIAEDTLGRIWFGHLNGGLSLFDGNRVHKAEI